MLPPFVHLKRRITTGGFPFSATFDAYEVDSNGNYVVVNVLKAVQAGYREVKHWSLPFDTSTPEKYAKSLEVGQQIRNCGVDVIPVGFTVPALDPTTQPTAFVAFLKAQVKLSVALKARHLMVLPEGWRKDVGEKPFVGDQLTEFLGKTAMAIADGLADAPNGFRITLEMLSPHELRNINNLTVAIRLVCMVREMLAQRGQMIDVGLTVDSAHLFYARVATRKCVDVAFGGAVDIDDLLEQFAFAVRNGYVFALHVSLEAARSHPLLQTVDGMTLPLELFLRTAIENGFVDGPIDVEVMLPTHPVIVGSRLEGVPVAANWDVAKPEAPIVETLFEMDRILAA